MQGKCLFCCHEKFELVGENVLSYAIRDKYPVTELHTLILSKKHYETVFDLPQFELISIFELAKICRDKIIEKDDTVKGFNFGSNSGVVAGQKVKHVHFHLIPRRAGDIAPPPARQ
ncbi:HIT family protein [Sedimenticola sp.]|uniref:HIT family protein n=1 Tax=Sedimenticola sp. TaxID=1940285 RepID=UPI003D0FAFD5